MTTNHDGTRPQGTNELQNLQKAFAGWAENGFSEHYASMFNRAGSDSEAARLEALRESCERYGLLPRTAPKPTVARRPSANHGDGRRRSYDGGSHQCHHERGRSDKSRER